MKEMLAKFEADQHNDLYHEGYTHGLMCGSAKKVDIDYLRGYNDAMNDLCDFERENCC